MSLSHFKVSYEETRVIRVSKNSSPPVKTPTWPPSKQPGVRLLILKPVNLSDPDPTTTLWCSLKAIKCRIRLVGEDGIRNNNMTAGENGKTHRVWNSLAWLKEIALYLLYNRTLVSVQHAFEKLQKISWTSVQGGQRSQSQLTNCDGKNYVHFLQCDGAIKTSERAERRTECLNRKP